ncbi:protein GPR108 [Ornithorhynchus anatinus]|uniref:G protein-coupled receptor 108 n=1 Tax=Ornithorhynchus anatinus TaxID=9258 RepID=A0A6I8N423_ORNAN|nr:protein GPR108 [Ornithorhynchus anatinus]
MAESGRRGLGSETPEKVARLLLLGLLLVEGCSARIHLLELTGEKRAAIHLNSFGFYANGTLEVNLSRLQFDFDQAGQANEVGFSLSRVKPDSIRSYMATEPHTCALDQKNSSNLLILFLIKIKEKRVQVHEFGVQKKLHIRSGLLPEGWDVAAESQSRKLPQPQWGNGTDGPNQDSGEQLQPGQEAESQVASGKGDLVLALGHLNNSYNFSFHLVISSQAEGLYNLNFHNCYNINPGQEKPYNITVMIREKNPEGFLSAAEIPLFKLYLVMAACFLGAASSWVSILCKHRHNIFKIHWLMAALAFTKSISLLFRSINYYFINNQGHPIEGLAIMYYITHLLKGALLFITIVLIGTGWTFVKYILSDKEKKVFIIVIPLQVLANIAYIIIESTEEGTSDYALWKEILFLVDLICCGAILLPVVWSIRHLQEASNMDGKVAMNLAKLKLFRHYYVMIVCYIYFTRIIAILLRVIVPFQWQWLYNLLVEVSTLVFFVLTGYKFRPASNNPYLQLPQEEDEEDDIQMDQVVTESGLREGLSKGNKTANG